MKWQGLRWKFLHNFTEKKVSLWKVVKGKRKRKIKICVTAKHNRHFGEILFMWKRVSDKKRKSIPKNNRNITKRERERKGEKKERKKTRALNFIQENFRIDQNFPPCYSLNVLNPNCLCWCSRTAAASGMLKIPRGSTSIKEMQFGRCAAELFFSRREIKDWF